MKFKHKKRALDYFFEMTELFIKKDQKLNFNYLIEIEKEMKNLNLDNLDEDEIILQIEEEKRAHIKK
jgi:hypothetical protein